MTSEPTGALPGEPYGENPADPTTEALGNALRRLMDAAVLTRADADELAPAITVINDLAARLEGSNGELLNKVMPWPPPELIVRGDRPHNPVVGAGNPLSPPMVVRVLDDGTVTSEITMRPIHEGPPGYIHGGWVATLLDQLIGMANTVANGGGMTAEITIRYRRGTPYGVPLTLRARTDSVDGRRMYASGEIIADGKVTAEGSGIFIRPSEERRAQIQRHIDEIKGRADS